MTRQGRPSVYNSNCNRPGCETHRLCTSLSAPFSSFNTPFRYTLFTQLQTLIVCLVVLTTFLITALSHSHGFVTLSTFRISHAHPIFNWFSQGAQDARHSICFFR